MTSQGVRQPRLPGRRDQARIALPSAPVSCRLAREFVLSVTGGSEDPRVALVVTELVTNAVVHGHARPTLRVGWNGYRVHLEVEDDGPGRPTLRPFNPTTTSGRGLALVDQMADEWGVEAATDPSGLESGKVVWADIDLGR